MNTPVLDDVRSTARSAGAAAISTLEGAFDGVSDALASIDADRFTDVVGVDQVGAAGRVIDRPSCPRGRRRGWRHRGDRGRRASGSRSPG